MGATAAKNALTGASEEIDDSALPRITFTTRQIAAVGLTEDEAKRRGSSPALDESDQRITVATYRLLARGEPVPPLIIAERVGLPLERVVSGSPRGRACIATTRSGHRVRGLGAWGMPRRFIRRGANALHVPVRGRARLDIDRNRLVGQKRLVNRRFAAVSTTPSITIFSPG
ncbi:MAG: hypothetical protein ACRDLL_02265 [Solirubrobacterales bacterium]